MPPFYLLFARQIVWCACLCLLAQLSIAKPSTQFYTCSWQEVQRIALHQDKPIFVEVYATDNETTQSYDLLFNDTEVSTYYNANFINYRVDYNSDLGKLFRQQYHVGSASELLFLDTDGTIMYRKIGLRGKNEMLTLAQTALSRYLLNIGMMEHYYQKGYRVPAFLYDYAYELRKQQLPDTQVVNDYIQRKKLDRNITSLEDLQFIYDFADNPYTNALSVLCKHKFLFDKKYSPQVVDQRIENIAMNNVQQAATRSDEKLYRQTRKIIEKSRLDAAESLLLRIDAAYFNTSVEK